NQFLAFVVPQNQRAEGLALSQDVSTNHEILLASDFDLDPLLTSPRFITAAGVLGDDSFQPLLPHNLQQLGTLTGKVIGIADDFVRQHNRLQKLPAVDQRRFAQVVTLQIEKIEGEKVQRVRLAAFDRFVKSHPVLQQLEAGNTIFIKRHDLSVENGVLGADALGQRRCNLGKLLLHDVASTRCHAHFAVVEEAEGAVSIPLDFEKPVRALWQSAAQHGQHWLQL